MPANFGQKIKVSAPGTALQQMCNYVAIAETKSPSETLCELILHTLVTFEKEKASRVQEVADILKTIFGVDVPEHQVQNSLDQLASTGQVHKPLGTNYVLTPAARTKVKARIDEASQLQERVRMQWLAELLGQFPGLNADHAWAALENYLAKAFLRHGIQVAAFLDPSVQLPTDYAASLSSLLAEAVKSKFDLTRQEPARHAISDFLASVGQNQERAQFITECADGAANYFSLAVSPEVAKQFRDKLSPLVLFCDTNFLFGILNLHVHPLVEVSNHLLEAIAQHNLPLSLRYHAATLSELQMSISHYAGILRKHRWSRSLSRAATTSRFMSGIELKYHQKNAESGIEVDAFLRPFQHVDVLLRDHKIDVYRPPADRLTERATLEADYKDFLHRLGKEKSYELVAHDVTVLDCVRSLQSIGPSTIDASALFVTCDFTLYRFDRNAKTQASVVLPNVLWQILRPFIPASHDFDRSFAETFAIPEFRTIGSGAAKACSKMLGLLSAYKDIPEETAARLLSNDLLIDHLRTAENDEQFKEQVESAITSENQALLEERAAMARQIDSLRTDKARDEREIEKQKEEAARTRALLSESEAARAAAANTARQEADHRQEAENRTLFISKVSSIIVALLVSLAFEIVVHSVWRWDWLLRHPNSYGLQGCIFLMVSFGIVGLWVKPWRKALWVIGVFGVLFVSLQILGGPDKPP